MARRARGKKSLFADLYLMQDMDPSPVCMLHLRSRIVAHELASASSHSMHSGGMWSLMAWRSCGTVAVSWAR